ncbi:MAG: hypothetical protein HXY23_12130 [Parvularculaceae bacterium]|nr:hypothetical protein [Parvularculaceae bacterium]
MLAAGAVIAAASVLAQSLALDQAQSSWAQKTFPFWWGGKSEASRLLDKDWPAFEAAEAIAKLVPPGETALLFRQAEVAFYTRVKFVYFFDATVAPIFVMKDPAAAAAALIDRQIRWIAAPDYRMPEIDNSAIGEIIADPKFATLVEDFSGFRLYRLNDEAARAVGIKAAAEQRFSSLTPAEGFWRVQSGAGSSASRIRSLTDGRIAVSMPHRLFGSASQVSEIVSVRPEDAVAELFFVDLPASERRLRISADLEGRGRAEVILQKVTLQVDPTRSADPLPETPVWKGVLLGERRTVTGQILEPGSNSVKNELIGYRLVIRLLGPGEIVFGGWKADAIHSSPAREPADERGSADMAANVGRNLRPEVSLWSGELIGSKGADLDLNESAEGVSFYLAPRQHARISGPWLMDSELSRKPDGAPTKQGLDEASLRTIAGALGVEPFSLSARFILSGSGLATARLVARCADGAEVTNSSDPVRLKATPTEHLVRVRAGCRPIIARLDLIGYAPSLSGAQFNITLPIISVNTPVGDVPFEPNTDLLTFLAPDPRQ